METFVISRWQYLVAVKEEECDYPKFCDICSDFDKIQNVISMLIEHKMYPDGFDTEKEAKLAFKNIKKELKKVLNLKLYDKTCGYFPDEMVSALKVSVCDEASFNIEGFGVVYVSTVFLSIESKPNHHHD